MRFDNDEMHSNYAEVGDVYVAYADVGWVGDPSVFFKVIAIDGDNVELHELRTDSKCTGSRWNTIRNYETLPLNELSDHAKTFAVKMNYDDNRETMAFVGSFPDLYGGYYRIRYIKEWDGKPFKWTEDTSG